MPAPTRLVMCRPTHYRIAYEINPWMSLKRPAHVRRAQAQWERLYALLTRTLKAHVWLLPAHPAVPDLVFTANAGLVHGRTLIRSNFRYPQRRREEPLIERYFRRRGYRIRRLGPQHRFEGEGDALWLGSSLIIGFRFRSEAPVHEELAEILKAEVLPVELADSRFYHLDTCFCPLPGGAVLWYPKAFDRYGRRVIERQAAELIAVSERDAARFACNAVVVGDSIVIQAGASGTLVKALTRRGLRVYALDLSEFLKAGGSAKCLVLQLDPRRGDGA